MELYFEISLKSKQLFNSLEGNLSFLMSQGGFACMCVCVSVCVCACVFMCMCISDELNRKLQAPGIPHTVFT